VLNSTRDGSWEQLPRADLSRNAAVDVCSCPGLGYAHTETVKIRVSDGKPRRTPRSLRRFDTVEELFARVREQIERSTEGLDVRYSARTGVPKDFSADPLPMAIDDEFRVRVRELRITRRF